MEVGKIVAEGANKGPISGYESFEVPMKYANDGGDEAVDG